MPWKQTVSYYFTSDSTSGELLWKVSYVIVLIFDRFYYIENLCSNIYIIYIFILYIYIYIMIENLLFNRLRLADNRSILHTKFRAFKCMIVG